MNSMNFSPFIPGCLLLLSPVMLPNNAVLFCPVDGSLNIVSVARDVWNPDSVARA